MKFLVLTILVWCYLQNAQTLNCYWNNGCYYKYFSSKTPYEFVRGDIRDSIVKLPGCQPVSLWIITRHGKRNPSEKYIQDMKNILKYKDIIVYNYEIGNSSLCAQDIDNIKNWNDDTDMFNKPNEITVEGLEDSIGLGRRIKEAFSELLNELQDKDYLFFPAFGGRILESAKAFSKGLDTLLTANSSSLRTNYNDTAPYSICGKFQAEVHRNRDTYKPVMEYMRTAEFVNMKGRIEKKLGLNFTLTDDHVISIYDLCRYIWNGITNEPSPWCAILSVEDLQILEYVDDLRHYYRNGYGVSKYAKVLSRITLADMFKKFKQAKNGEGRKIVSHFSHATVMDMILVGLNLNKDTNPLTAYNRDVNRKWRTTFFSTFSSNLVAVLNRCSKHDNGTSFDYNVALYWNERPLIEMCQKGVCSWQEFESIFWPFLNVTSKEVCGFTWTIVDK